MKGFKKREVTLILEFLKGSESFCFDGIAIKAKYYGHPTTKVVKKGQKRELYLWALLMNPLIPSDSISI